jgi:hypothetical protein
MYACKCEAILNSALIVMCKCVDCSKLDLDFTQLLAVVNVVLGLQIAITAGNISQQRLRSGLARPFTETCFQV